MLGSVLQTAMWATAFMPCAPLNCGSPILATSVAMPYFLCITSKCVLCRLVWVLIAPLCCHNRSIDCKGIVRTDILPMAEGTAVARSNSELGLPVGNHGLSAVWVTGWTFSTRPPHLLAAARCDADIAKVGVLGVIPLALHQGVQAANVWAVLLLLLLLQLRCMLLGKLYNVLIFSGSCIASLDKLSSGWPKAKHILTASNTLLCA